MVARGKGAWQDGGESVWRMSRTGRPAASPEGSPAWLLLPPEAVPEPWLSRSREVRLVPLLPEEAVGMLRGGGAPSELTGDELPLARLLARGLSAAAISKELGLSVRTVERRLAHLRDRFGVRSTAELATLFSERGFR